VEDGGVSIASVENNAPVICGPGALVSQACGSAHSTMLKAQKRPGDTYCWFDTTAAPRGGGTQADCAWMRTGHD